MRRPRTLQVHVQHHGTGATPSKLPGSPRGDRPASAVPSRSRASERLAADADGHGRRDAGDEPPRRRVGRDGRLPRGRQRGRRRAGGGRGADGRRADGQRSRGRRVRDRLARRRAARLERVGPLTARARRDPRRRDGPALGDRPGRRPGLGRPGGALRAARARPGALPRRRAGRARRRLHAPDRRQVGARRDRAVLCSRPSVRDSSSPTSPRRCACWRSTARMRSTAAPSPSRSQLPRGWTRTISPTIARNGSSRSASTIEASRSASCHRTARAPRPSWRSRCTTASSRASIRSSRP